MIFYVSRNGFGSSEYKTVNHDGTPTVRNVLFKGFTFQIAVNIFVSIIKVDFSRKAASESLEKLVVGYQSALYNLSELYSAGKHVLLGQRY